MIALLDYGAGNLTSVRKALAHLDADVLTPSTPAELATASGIIVPGVGHFEATAALGSTWRAAIRERVRRGTPLLGICVGMQWLFDGSAEAETCPGLGLLSGRCQRLAGTAGPGSHGADGESEGLKVPHVGWNSLHLTHPSWLLDGLDEGDQVYFTHSFAAPVTTDCVGSTHYGIEFAAAVERDRVAGVQFHPEKSADVGLRILGNFLRLVAT